MPGNTVARYGLIPYQLRTFVGGLSDYEDKGIAGSFKSGYGADIRKQIDSLSGQQALKDDLATGHITGKPNFIVPASDGNTYIFCEDGKIFRRDINGSYLIQGSGIAPIYTETKDGGRILGACEWYSQNNFSYLIWATPFTVNIKKIAGPAYIANEPWTDVNVADTGSWPKSNLTFAPWHTMCIANGNLQITNGNVMALVGYDLSYTNNSLALIPGNSAKCVLERGKYGIIGCTKTDFKDETTLFAWDGIGLSWNDKEIIKIGGLNSMLDTEIALAQIGTNGQLWVSDFNTPLPFRQIRGGGQSDVDGMTAYKGLALVGIYNNTNLVNGHLCNGVYSIGRTNKNAPICLNLEYQLDCDEIYSVKTVGSDVLVAYRLNGQYGIKHIDTDNKSDWIYQSLDLIAPVGTRRYPIPLGRMLFWSTVDLQCSPLPAGVAIEIWYRLDKVLTGGPNNDGWYQANTEQGNPGAGLQFNTKGKQNAVFFIGQKARVLEVMVKGLASGSRSPEVNEINSYFRAG